MQKIPTLFLRQLTTEVTPGCEWVLENKGYATRKYDGTCCLIREGKLYKRREVKYFRDGSGQWVGFPPMDFISVTGIDPVTGKQQGWMPVTSEDKWHLEARDCTDLNDMDGTYELCGPKVNNNPEGLGTHVLIPHGETRLSVVNTFEGIREYLKMNNIEGIVWYLDDMRAKIKGKDFGIKRK